MSKRKLISIINRVWIVKKSISLNDRHIDFPGKAGPPPLDIIGINLVNPHENVFNIKNKYNSIFKHWAIILELSKDSYVNIQFGRNINLFKIV